MKSSTVARTWGAFRFWRSGISPSSVLGNFVQNKGANIYELRGLSGRMKLVEENEMVRPSTPPAIHEVCLKEDVAQRNQREESLKRRPFLPLGRLFLENVLATVIALGMVFIPVTFVPAGSPGFLLTLSADRAVALSHELPKVEASNPSWYALENQPLQVITRDVQDTDIRLDIGKTLATINSLNYTLEAAPYIKNSRTMVPVRFVTEALGANVGWDGTQEKVTIGYEGRTIVLWIGKTNAEVEGFRYILDAAPEIGGSRTFVPLRFIAENFGSQVEWKATIREVSIRKKKVSESINLNSDADKDGLTFTQEKAIGTNPNDKNTVYDSLGDKALWDLSVKYPGLNIFADYPDRITKLTLPDKAAFELNPLTAHNMDNIVDDKIVITYALLANPGIQNRTGLDATWADFTKKYTVFIVPLKENLTNDTVGTIDIAAESLLRFVNLNLDKILEIGIDKSFIFNVIKLEKLRELAPVFAVYSDDFIKYHSDLIADLEKKNLDFVKSMITTYSNLSITGIASIKTIHPEFDFSDEKWWQEASNLSSSYEFSSNPNIIAYTNPKTYKGRYALNISFADGVTVDRLDVFMPSPRNWCSQIDTALLDCIPKTTNAANYDPLYGNKYLYYDKTSLTDNSFSMSQEFRFTCYEVNTHFENIKETYEYDKNSAEFKLYTRDEPEIETNYFKDIVKSVIGDEKNPVEICRKIYNFVINYMTYGDINQPGGAKKVYINKKGDCGGYSTLFVALTRAAGIPARVVVGGWATSSGGVYNNWHAWAEFYLEQIGWIPVDPMMGSTSTGNRDYYFGNLDDNRYIASKGLNIPLNEHTPVLFQTSCWWWWGYWTKFEEPKTIVTLQFEEFKP